MSDERDDDEPTDEPTDAQPGVYIGHAQLAALMGRRVHLNEGMRTVGANVSCGCGWLASARTRQARDEHELEHRRYHDHLTELRAAERDADAARPA